MPPRSAGAGRKADLIFTGGPIFDPSGWIVGHAASGSPPAVTMGAGPERPPVPAAVFDQAVAVSGSRISAAGPAGQVLNLAGPRTRVVDLRGRLLLPGFIDAHAHLVAYGASRLEVNCKYPNVRSIRDIQDRLRERAASLGTPEQWVRARGYDQSRLAERRHPTRFDLDRACPDRPVLLTRACGHIAVANSRALAMAGITATTPDPPGGRFDRDKRGAPNGVLRENAWLAMADLTALSLDEMVAGIAAATLDYLHLGVTSVHEAGVDARAWQAYQIHQGTGADVADGGGNGQTDETTPPGPRLRVYAMVVGSAPDFRETFLGRGLATGAGDQWLRVGPFKLMTDGSSSGPTAATREPYAVDASDHGILYLSQEEISERFLEASRAGFQVTAHAVGDRAVEMVVNGIAAVLEDQAGDGPVSRRRHRIEHCAMTDPPLRARIKALGIVPVLQPVFLHEFGEGYVRNYGRSRAEAMFAAGAFCRDGVPFALSTDCPVTFPDPLLNVYTALTRRTMDGDVLGPDERLSVAQALGAYTRGGAYAAGEEKDKGGLEPGQLADLVVLSGNPLEARPEELPGMKAVMTVLDGRVVFEA